MRRVLGSVLALRLAACAVAAPSFSHESIHGDAAPILSSSNAEVVPNSYIVKFKDHVTPSVAENHHAWVQQVHAGREIERSDLRKRSQIPLLDDVFRGLRHTFHIGEEFLGYSGHFDDSTIEHVRRHPDVRLTLIHSCRSPAAGCVMHGLLC